MLVIIDNYDSFTYNIVQTVAANGLEDGRTVDIRVFRNDRITIREIKDLNPDRLLISPGPCTPAEAGISVAVIQYFAGRVPILGVCLGHQAMAEAFGGSVIRAGRIMHGKTSPMYHDGKGVFSNLSDPFNGMRYHSLIVDDKDLPDCFEVSCRTDKNELMAIRHKEMVMEGVQFHPESIMTPDGIILLKNFMDARYPDSYNRTMRKS